MFEGGRSLQTLQYAWKYGDHVKAYRMCFTHCLLLALSYYCSLKVIFLEAEFRHAFFGVASCNTSKPGPNLPSFLNTLSYAPSSIALI